MLAVFEGVLSLILIAVFVQPPSDYFFFPRDQATTGLRAVRGQLKGTGRPVPFSCPRQSGHESRVCYSGEEALACLAEFRPHAIMLDHGMPGMSGDDVARRIREQPEHSNLVLVALTGFAGEIGRFGGAFQPANGQANRDQRAARRRGDDRLAGAVARAQAAAPAHRPLALICGSDTIAFAQPTSNVAVGRIHRMTS